MALYSLHSSVISRAKGQSAVRSTAYIVRGEFCDERTQENVSYSSREDNIWSKLYHVGNTADFLESIEEFSNFLELEEDRILKERFSSEVSFERASSEARTARKIHTALPNELGLSEWKEIVNRFVERAFTSRGLLAVSAIHFEENNPHVHLLYSTRPYEGEGRLSSKKLRDLDTREDLKWTRALWAEITNEILKEKGFIERIDHRSYKERGINLLPTHHEGWKSRDLQEKGEYSRIAEENRSIKQSNLQALLKNPVSLLKVIANEEGVFTKDRLEQEVKKRIGDEASYKALKRVIRELGILKKVPHEGKRIHEAYFVESEKRSDFLKAKFAEYILERGGPLELGKDPRNRWVYTLQALKEREDRIFSYAQKISDGGGVDEIPPIRVYNTLYEKYQHLTEQQKEAVINLCLGKNFGCVMGRAGSGKTTLLQAVTDIYKSSGWKVLGLTFQGAAAEVLQEKAGCPAHTLDRARIAWNLQARFEEQLKEHTGNRGGERYARQTIERILKRLEWAKIDERTVILVDEANMVGGRLWEPLLNQVSQRGGRIHAIGDVAQEKAHEPGDYFRGFVEDFGAQEVSIVFRQKQEIHRILSSHLNRHEVEEGLRGYLEEGSITWHQNKDATFKALVKAYIENPDPIKDKLALAYRNKDAFKINEQIREELKEKGQLQETIPFKINSQEMALGERIVFTQNENKGQDIKNSRIDTFSQHAKTVGIKNGNFGIITAYNERRKQISVKLDSGRTVFFNVEDYPHITYGYAITVNKSEGRDAKHVFHKVDWRQTANSILVSGTRHRETYQAFINEEEIKDFKSLLYAVEQPKYKALSRDFIETFPERHQDAFKNVSSYIYLKEELVRAQEYLGHILEEGITSEERHKIWKSYEETEVKLHSIALDICKNWDKHEMFINQAELKRREIEETAGLKLPLLSKEQEEGRDKAQEYAQLCIESQELKDKLIEDFFTKGMIPSQNTIFKEHETLQEKKCSLASELALNPASYKVFLSFKVRTETQEKSSLLGHTIALGDTLPYSWARVLRDSKTHEEKGKEEESLKSNIHFQEYKKHDKDRKLIYQAYLKDLKKEGFFKEGESIKSLLYRPDINQHLRAHRNFGIFEDLQKQKHQAAYLFHETIKEQIFNKTQIVDKDLEILKKDAALHEKEIKKAKYKVKENKESDKLSTEKKKEAQTTELEQKERKEAPKEINFKSIRNELTKNGEAILDKILPFKHKKRFGSQIEYQGEGFKITFNGQKGLWHDFKSAKGGSISALLEEEWGLKSQGRGSKVFWERAASLVGGLHHYENQVFRPSSIHELPCEQERIKVKQAKAQNLYNQSLSISETLGEKYLREIRGIKETNLPQDVRFSHEAYDGQSKTKRPAMMAFARNWEGEITGGQMIFLGDQGQKADIPVPKRSFGAIKGSFITIKEASHKSNPLYIAEGVETALSLNEAGINGHIIAALGINNMKAVLEKDPYKHIVICADNDGQYSVTRKVVQELAIQLLHQGKRVEIVSPEKEKTDFNDVLKTEGPKGIQDLFEKEDQNLEPEKRGQVTKADLIRAYEKDYLQKPDEKIFEQFDKRLKYESSIYDRVLEKECARNYPGKSIEVLSGLDKLLLSEKTKFMVSLIGQAYINSSERDFTKLYSQACERRDLFSNLVEDQKATLLSREKESVTEFKQPESLSVYAQKLVEHEMVYGKEASPISKMSYLNAVHLQETRLPLLIADIDKILKDIEQSSSKLRNVEIKTQGFSQGHPSAGERYKEDLRNVLRDREFKAILHEEKSLFDPNITERQKSNKMANISEISRNSLFISLTQEAFGNLNRALVLQKNIEKPRDFEIGR